jgi:hypothetical protein
VNPEEWHIVFFIAAAIYIVTNTVFLIYGTSERQPWNEPVNECSSLSKSPGIINSLFLNEAHAFLLDYTKGERVVSHANPVRISGC